MANIKKYGIDVSSWNGNINLAPYKGQFVIIRAGFDITEDIKARRNMDECERLGIPYGVYWYSYALNPTQAKAEAQACLKVIKGRNIKVGVWFDMEDADGWKRNHGFSFTRNNISAICNAFCDVFASKKYYIGIYASRSWIDSYISCPKYDKWVAQWGSNNGKVNADTSSLGSLLQYTSRPLDKNLSYVDLSHFTKGSPEPTPTPKKKLTVDGVLGAQSIIALQKWMGTYQDGEISGQLKSQQRYFTSLIAVTFGGGGSIVIRRLQSYLNQKGYKGKDNRVITEDGLLGRNTIYALQKFLISKGFSCGNTGADGYLGRDTAKGLQKFLNTQV